MATRPIPVILDTDIGTDIDDTWALAMLLKSPELDTRLIVTDRGDTEYRAKLVAKLLEVAGRTDIPVGVGILQEKDHNRQEAWVAEYDLDAYPGTVRRDGVDAIIETIMGSDEPVTLIAIGPMPNLKAALAKEPRIAEKAHFVGMHGSFRKHHSTNLNNRTPREGAIAEWNVVCDVGASQAVFSAPWKSVTITPLDTCGGIVFEGERYARLRDATDPVMRAVIENYRLWSPRNEESDPESHSSVLFDTVAVYLASSTEGLVMKEMGVRVDDKGFTVEDPAAPAVNVALDWADLEGYYDFLEKRLLAPVVPAPARVS